MTSTPATAATTATTTTAARPGTSDRDRWTIRRCGSSASTTLAARPRSTIRSPRELPTDWDLVLLDLPGRGKRHAEPLRHKHAGVGEPDRRRGARRGPTCRTRIFGHSLGAVIAIEVARALEHGASSPPAWVGVSGRAAPSFQGHLRGRLYELDDDSLLSELISMGGTPERIQNAPAFVEHFLRVAR